MFSVVVVCQFSHCHCSSPECHRNLDCCNFHLQAPPNDLQSCGQVCTLFIRSRCFHHVFICPVCHDDDVMMLWCCDSKSTNYSHQIFLSRYHDQPESLNAFSERSPTCEAIGLSWQNVKRWHNTQLSCRPEGGILGSHITSAANIVRTFCSG